MIKNKKILINGVTLVSDGLFPHLLTKYRYFQSQGYQLYILCPDKIYPLNTIDDVYTYSKQQSFYKTLHSGNISKFTYIILALTENIKALVNIKKIIKSDFDIIYSQSSVLNLTLIPFILKIFRKKTIWATIFDNTVPLFDPGNPIVRLLAWIFFHFSLVLLRQADLIFVISEDLKNYLHKNGFKLRQLAVTGNAIETDTLRLAKKSPKYNYDSLYVGRINETKGIYDLLEVLKIITKTYPSFTLAIMGSGDSPTIKKFKEKINDYNLTRNEKFLGFQIGIKKYSIIKSSKTFIFLSQSKSESFGIALLEAVSCGLPAITYDLLPYRSLYKYHEIYSYPIGSIGEIAQKLIEIFKHKQFVNLPGKKLLGKYSWEHIGKLELDHINKILK